MALGFEVYHLGDPIEAVIIQANHLEYGTLHPEDLPGARAIIDGRKAVSSALAKAIPTIVLGSFPA